MSSIRFEPSVSATFAVDRNPSGNGGDLFADMLGEQLSKRAEADRPEPVTRRRPPADRRIQDEDRQPAARQSRNKVKHAHDLRDVAAAARDVTPPTGEQGRIAAPASGPVASMDDVAPNGDPMDKDQQEPALITTEVAAEAVTEVPDQSVAITTDPQAPVLGEDQMAATAEAADGAAAIAPAEPDQADPAATPTAEGDDGTDEAAQADLAASLAATLGDGVLGLMAGDGGLGAGASSQILASAGPAALAVAKAVKPAMAEASQAAAELAAKITPEAPRPAAEIKARPAVRATPPPRSRPRLRRTRQRKLR